MRIPTKNRSNYRKPQYGGIPIDVQAKKQLRNRSVLLSSTQRQILKQIGVKVDQKTTEKEAVMLVKRICGPATNYPIDPKGSKLFRKCHTPKPKGVTKRQHLFNELSYREEQGSKRASKALANL